MVGMFCPGCYVVMRWEEVISQVRHLLSALVERDVGISGVKAGWGRAERVWSATQPLGVVEWVKQNPKRPHLLQGLCE